MTSTASSKRNYPAPASQSGNLGAWSVLKDGLNFHQHQVVSRRIRTGDHMTLAEQSAMEQLQQPYAQFRAGLSDEGREGLVGLHDVGRPVAEETDKFVEFLLLRPCAVMELVS